MAGADADPGRGQRRPLPLRGERLYSAMYLNELVLRLCARGDPHGDLFEHYLLCLQRLADGEPGWTLRRFERDLMDVLGYGIVLDRDCESRSGAGRRCQPSTYSMPVRASGAAGSGVLRISGAALRALDEDVMPGSTLRRIATADAHSPAAPVGRIVECMDIERAPDGGIRPLAPATLRFRDTGLSARIDRAEDAVPEQDRQARVIALRGWIQVRDAFAAISRGQAAFAH
ncbi:MAG: DNA repair protein RecO C-terminal domain-containing protein [Dokdonella sp.]